MKAKIIPVVGKCYALRFFELDIAQEDLRDKPHLAVAVGSPAEFALQMDDEGLEALSIYRGDYLLFARTLPLLNYGQIALVRGEQEYIVREAHWSGDTTLLRAMDSDSSLLELPTENIRIAAVLENVRKVPDDSASRYGDLPFSADVIA